VATADVDTARPLSDIECEKLRQLLSGAMGKPVRLVVRANAKLLAGVRVKIGDLMFEGSLRGRLERMSRLVH